MHSYYATLQLVAVFSFTLFSPIITLVNAEDAPSNQVPFCRNGQDGLEVFSGTKRICTESTAYDGLRCFFIYIPDCAGKNSPLVFDIHGFQSCPFFSAVYSGWYSKATENCFVLVWPLGNTNPDIADDTCWSLPGGLHDEKSGKTSSSCCCFQEGELVQNTDDPVFIREAASMAVKHVPEATSNTKTIDTKRIYMAGHSNGCMTAIAMAALHSDFVAAVGCHGGSAISPFPDSYLPTPILMVHGAADRIVPYSDKVNGSDFFFDHYFATLPAYYLIAKANGCTENEERRIIDEKNNYTTFAATSCTNSSDVVLILLDGVGHTPYLGAGNLIEPGTAPIQIDTTQLAWDFMKSHSSAVAPDLVNSPSSSPTISPSSSSHSSGRTWSIACGLMLSIVELFIFV